MKDSLKDAPVIVGYGRSPVGKAKKGAFANTNPIEIAGQTLRGVLQRVPNLNGGDVDELVVGCAFPENFQNFNIAKMVAFRAGLPDTTTAQTVSRICSSGLQAIATAANSIRAGEVDVCVAGGVESMSTTIMYPREEEKYDKLMEQRPAAYDHPAITAEKVAKLCNVSRQEQDAFAVESHRRAAAAQDAGCFDDQIIPLRVTNPEGEEVTVDRDEGVRRSTTMEGLSGLKPAFAEDGCVTPGNASQMSDGASFVVLMSQEKARELGVPVIARFLGFNVASLEPEHMGLGPVKAVPRLLNRLGFTIDDMDVIELNEAFAAQVLPCMRQVGMPAEKTNPEGGAIALGHPLGATGAILTCKAISRLKRTGGRYGLITMCIGGGMGGAGLVEVV